MFKMTDLLFLVFLLAHTNENIKQNRIFDGSEN